MILLVLNCSTKVSENSDMTKSWATFCCSGTYKKCLTKVLRNLGYVWFPVTKISISNGTTKRITRFLTIKIKKPSHRC